MKKHLSIFLAGTVVALLFTGCGGSSPATSGTPAQETGKTETTAISAQEEAATELISGQDEVSTEAVPEQEETGKETAGSQDKDQPAAQTSLRLASITRTDQNGRLSNKETYYEDGTRASWIISGTDGTYTIEFHDREYDEEGKWVGGKAYIVNSVEAANVEDIDLNAYRTKENLTLTKTCKYNDNGFVVESFTPGSEDGEPLITETYDSQGRIISEQSGEDNIGEYTYNEQGVLVKTVGKTRDTETLIEYTPFGVTSIMTLYQSKDSDGGMSSVKMELHYDDKGILTGGDSIQDGETTGTATFELDEQGNILRSSYFDKDGNLTGTAEYGLVPADE